MFQRLTINTKYHIAHFPKFKWEGLRVVAAALVLMFLIQSHVSARTFDEYQLKAVFLYRLSLFITWPEKAFAAPGQPFIIGIAGEDPFETHLEQVVRNEKIGEHPIQIERYTTLENALKADCQILFINQALDHRWLKLKHQFQNHSILTVSDMPRFGQMGGMVNIQTEDNRIKIEINPEETRKAGLSVSSKLLKVARQVKSDDQGGGQ